MTNSSNESPKTPKDNKWPYVDIIEYNQQYIFEMELPGFKKEDISIYFDQESNLLTFEGKYKERIRQHDIVTVEDDDGNLTSNCNKLEKDSRIVVNERQSKKNFERSFKMKKPIAHNKVIANFNDGVLVIKVPKLPHSKNKKIKINIQ